MLSTDSNELQLRTRPHRGPHSCPCGNAYGRSSTSRRPQRDIDAIGLRAGVSEASSTSAPRSTHRGARLPGSKKGTHRRAPPKWHAGASGTPAGARVSMRAEGRHSSAAGMKHDPIGRCRSSRCSCPPWLERSRRTGAGSSGRPGSSPSCVGLARSSRRLLPFSRPHLPSVCSCGVPRRQSRRWSMSRSSRGSNSPYPPAPSRAPTRRVLDVLCPTLFSFVTSKPRRFQSEKANGTHKKITMVRS